MDLRDPGAPHHGFGPEAEANSKIKSAVRMSTDYAKGRAEAAVDHGKGSVVRKMDSLAGAFHAAADSLRANQEDWLGRHSRSTASSVERMSEHLKANDLSTLFSEIGDLGRRRRGLFLGGALLSGIAIGRFLRSSAQVSEEVAPGALESRSDFDSDDQYWGPQA